MSEADSKKRKRSAEGSAPLLVIDKVTKLLQNITLGALPSFKNTRTSAEVFITLSLLREARGACEWCCANITSPQGDKLGWNEKQLRGDSKKDKVTGAVIIKSAKSAWTAYAGNKFCVEVCVGKSVVGFVMCQGATSTDEQFMASGHASSKKMGKLIHRNLADLEWIKTEHDTEGRFKGVMCHAVAYLCEQIKKIDEFGGIIAVIRDTNEPSKRLALAVGLEAKGETFLVKYKGPSQSFVWLKDSS